MDSDDEAETDEDDDACGSGSDIMMQYWSTKRANSEAAV
jgi:hypothetical protein